MPASVCAVFVRDPRLSGTQGKETGHGEGGGRVGHGACVTRRMGRGPGGGGGEMEQG